VGDSILPESLVGRVDGERERKRKGGREGWLDGQTDR